MTNDGDQRLFDRRFSDITADVGDDSLAPTRGALYGLGTSAIFWAVIGLIIWLVS